MKTIEKNVLKAVRVVVTKQTGDPRIPGCVAFYHQPKRPRK